MKPFPSTTEFLSAAKRIVWFKTPEDALARPIELMAYAMKHSLDEDMALLLDHVGIDGLREAIECAARNRRRTLMGVLERARGIYPPATPAGAKTGSLMLFR